MTAVKMIRRIIRHQCYDYIYQHKMDQKQNFEFFHLSDEDMFVDLKLNYMVPEEKNF